MCPLRKIIFSSFSPMISLTVLSVDYPLLYGVSNLLVILFSVCWSWHYVVGFWDISFTEPQLNKHHKRDLIMTSVSDSTTHRSKKKLPNIPPEELALHGNGGSLEGVGKPHDLPPEVQVQFIRHAQKIAFIDRAGYNWVWKKVAGWSWKRKCRTKTFTWAKFRNTKTGAVDWKPRWEYNICTFFAINSMYDCKMMRLFFFSCFIGIIRNAILCVKNELWTD